MKVNIFDVILACKLSLITAEISLKYIINDSKGNISVSGYLVLGNFLEDIIIIVLQPLCLWSYEAGRIDNIDSIIKHILYF